MIIIAMESLLFVGDHNGCGFCGSLLLINLHPHKLVLSQDMNCLECLLNQTCNTGNYVPQTIKIFVIHKHRLPLTEMIPK